MTAARCRHGTRFSALGFYPVCPGTDQYVLGAPYMPYACVKLPDGKTLEVKAPGVSDTKRYIKSVKLNGKPYDKAYITHSDLMAGGKLEFQMSSRTQTNAAASVPTPNPTHFPILNPEDLYNSIYIIQHKIS